MQSNENTPAGGLYILKHGNHVDRPTIIFLHESLGSVELWRDFPKKLGKLTQCNVLVYDRQGYGKSAPFSFADRKTDYLEREADILKLLIEHWKLKDVILFGHSDGGSIALIAAAKYPSHIRGVITEGAHIFVEEITLQGIREAVKAFHATNLKQRLQKYHGDKTEAVFWAWANTWLSDEFRSWNIENFLPRINCPVLVIQGEDDKYGTRQQVNGIVSQVSGQATELIIPSTGHTPHREAKEVVLNHATSFIKQLIPTS